MELSSVPGDCFAGYLVEDSDLEYSDCSEGESSDEGCGLQHHSSHQKADRKQDQSSEDEFEKEMASEVLSAIKTMALPGAGSKEKPKVAGLTKPHPTADPPQESPPEAASSKSQFYDEVYFDSSESSDDEGAVPDDEGPLVGTAAGEGMEAKGGGQRESSGGRKRKANKKQRLTNDDLFYDPNMDDEDEKWMNRQRMAYHNVKVSKQLEQEKKTRLSKEQDLEAEGSGAKQRGPSGGVRSDAVLNCPACMCTLCLDCQRHDKYPNQYRAMFVLNCRVMTDEVLKYIPKPSKGKRRKENKTSEASAASNSQEVEGYHLVRCSDCNTEVAVVDKDEVFHFFNVLPSAP